MKHLFFLTVLALLVNILPANAQKMMQLTLDEKTDFVLQEAGAIFHQAKDVISVMQLLPENMRSAENKNIDLKEGDIVLMVNGKRIKSVQDFRKLYDDLKIGDELKLGVKRDGPIIVTIRKADPAKNTGGKMMKIMSDGKSGDALPGIGFVETAGKNVLVKDVFDPESISGKNFKQKDILRSLNGTPLTSVKELIKEYEKIPVNGKAEFSVTRAGKDITVSINKPDIGKVKVIKR